MAGLSKRLAMVSSNPELEYDNPLLLVSVKYLDVEEKSSLNEPANAVSAEHDEDVRGSHVAKTVAENKAAAEIVRNFMV